MTIKKESRESQLIKLSASAAKNYDQCPHKYFLNYIKRAPKKKWAHFDLGNLCHRTLEFFHESIIKKPISKKLWPELMGKCFAKARKGYPKMDNKLVQEAKGYLSYKYNVCPKCESAFIENKCINNKCSETFCKDSELKEKIGYLGMLEKEGLPNVIGVETSFKFNIGENILLRGFVDRLDTIENEKFHIVDYKTSKSVRYLDKFQLLVYGLWLKREFPDLKEFKGSYLLLRHGSKLKSYDFTIEDVEKVERDLIVYADKIRYDDVWTPIPSGLCDWCDFKDICPAQETW